MTMTETEALTQLQIRYPQYATVRFDVTEGELGYILGAAGLIPEIPEMQIYLNQLLGQKVYRGEYIATTEVYATSPEEARTYLKQRSPKFHTLTVTETPETTLTFP